MIKKLLSLTVINCFFLTTLVPFPQAHADTVLGLPAPGTMVNLSPAYEPVMIKGLTIHKDNPFLFDFIVDVGQDKMSGEPLKKEGEKLIKYFLASLAIPDKDVWVNLSPYEKNKMIPEALGQTDMGRDLLEQDYILKQITASLIYPEKQLGKTFWNTVYSKAQEMYGTTQVPVNTFNKVWIMADRAEVYEHNQTAFVVDQHLKVMLEEDYLALQKHSVTMPLVHRNDTHSIGANIVKQIILPELEKEVNTGRNFANLRQIFNSIILSSWYKKNLQQALLNQVYADKSKVKGINLNDPTVKEQIYEQYLAAYKKGVFNYIKEDVNSLSGETLPRKYFSGGINEARAANPEITTDTAMLTNSLPQEGRLVDFATMATTQNGNPNAGHPLEFRLGKKTYQGQDVVSLDRRLYDYLQILNAFKNWANGEYNANTPFLDESKIKFIWEPVSDDHFFSKGAASVQEAVIAQYPIQGVTRNLSNNFAFYERLSREELIRRIDTTMYRLSKDYTAVSDVLDAAMTGKTALTDLVASSYIQAESILNQLMFPDLQIIFNFNQKDAKEQAQDILRTVVRSGAAQVLAHYIGQEGIDFQNLNVRQDISDLLSVIRGKIFSNGAYRSAEGVNGEMDALKEADRFLRQAAKINNPIERQAIVVLALDRLYSIDNPPAYSLREFLKSHISLTRSWARINGFLTETDHYIRVHDSAMTTTAIPALEITPALARAFDVQVGNFTATGRPTAGKDTLMPIFIEKMNKLLPEGNRIVTVSTGEYVAGIIRLVKNEYNQAQAGLKKNDEAKYGAYMGLLDDEDRAKMEGGDLVKDVTMYRIINKIFEEPWIANAKHIFFNGFPRNISQWNAIQDGKVLLRGKPLRINFFLDINLPREATFARAAKRTQDRIREGLPPRSDDDPLIVGERQNGFDTVTKPMVDDIALQNPAQFRRISSYFPDDTFEESLRKTSDQLIRTLHDFLGLPMHYDTFQQMFEAAEQGAFETKKYFYIKTTDSPSSREVMVSNIGDDWISGFEVGPAGVVKVGQGIVMIRKHQFAQARQIDAAMIAGIVISRKDFYRRIESGEIQKGTKINIYLPGSRGAIIGTIFGGMRDNLNLYYYNSAQEYRDNVHLHFLKPDEFDFIGNYTINNKLFKTELRRLEPGEEYQLGPNQIVTFKILDSAYIDVNSLGDASRSRSDELIPRDQYSTIKGIEINFRNGKTYVKNTSGYAISSDVKDAAMAASPVTVYDNYGQMYDATEHGAFKYVKFVDITYKGNGPDQKARARVRVSDIGGVWTDGFKVDEVKGIEMERIRISNDNFLRAQAADGAMTARDIAEMFLEDINEGNFRPERYTDFKDYTGTFPIQNISLQTGDIVLDDTSLEQQVEPLNAGRAIETSAKAAYVFTGRDGSGRVVVFFGSGLGNGTVLTVADRASVAQTPFTRGGIDLNTSNGMQWKVSKDGNGVEMDIDPAMIERLRREGIDSLSPVILRITPVADIQSLY